MTSRVRYGAATFQRVGEGGDFTLYVVTRRVYEDAFILADTPEEAMECAAGATDELYWYSARDPETKRLSRKYLRAIKKK